MSIDQLMLLGGSETTKAQASTSATSSSSKSILSLMAESQQQPQQDSNKSIRKFTFNTQLNIPSGLNQPSPRPVLTYGTNKKLKNSPTTFQITAADQPHFIPNQNTSDNLKNPDIHTSATTTGSRKRRKQEFSLKNFNEPVVSSSTLAYSVNTARYLNENTNISNNCTTLRLSAEVETKAVPGDSENGQSKLEEESCLSEEEARLLSKEFRYVASNGVVWTSKRRRSEIPLAEKAVKPRSYHYNRYADIKSSNDNRKTARKETISSKELAENLNEWKFHFVVSQVKSLITLENKSLEVIKDIEEYIENTATQLADDEQDTFADITVKINESIKVSLLKLLS